MARNRLTCCVRVHDNTSQLTQECARSKDRKASIAQGNMGYMARPPLCVSAFLCTPMYMPAAFPITSPGLGPTGVLRRSGAPASRGPKAAPGPTHTERQPSSDGTAYALCVETHGVCGGMYGGYRRRSGFPSSTDLNSGRRTELSIQPHAPPPPYPPPCCTATAAAAAAPVTAPASNSAAAAAPCATRPIILCTPFTSRLNGLTVQALPYCSAVCARLQVSADVTANPAPIPNPTLACHYCHTSSTHVIDVASKRNEITRCQKGHHMCTRRVCSPGPLVTGEALQPFAHTTQRVAFRPQTPGSPLR